MHRRIQVSTSDLRKLNIGPGLKRPLSWCPAGQIPGTTTGDSLSAAVLCVFQSEVTSYSLSECRIWLFLPWIIRSACSVYDFLMPHNRACNIKLRQKKKSGIKIKSRNAQNHCTTWHKNCQMEWLNPYQSNLSWARPSINQNQSIQRIMTDPDSLIMRQTCSANSSVNTRPLDI